MTETTTTEAKIAAARDAVDKAAALLLNQAEGLAMLAMMARHAERPMPQAIVLRIVGTR
ncbi:hypothetical protein MKK70_01285 [Methylobacterium sp. E-041]|jgi:hypothetical protein|uniref:hypothetical protein n=1 Tax=unclassified Methylobacterium TaxID=2615210 RepID=UPI0016508B9D|nr:MULTISPECIES: hypothetical protein [unclassified Methylobacterium]MCJ2020972.1 hypothetical protein [Methylobacterium sp. E-065]MCJ2076097.1 hypothetical protein [Methylobacterium sp. E-016]MCJ2104038.1 hypothetical protein [Methylobacterium sp. E-041]MCJ2117312.1 hypothetical protein [Methylobacterium sp. J-001]MCJ2130410.1 hypothetical protein [Methylobacterium sp. E-045]